MEQNERQRRTTHRNRKNMYRRLIEAGREELSELHMEILLTLYEQPTKDRAAAELHMTIDELDAELDAIMTWRKDTEPHTKEGLPRKKRLAREALVNILENHSDFTDDEEAMMRALIDSPNQVVAAKILGMSYADFAKQFLKVRRTHDF